MDQEWAAAAVAGDEHALDAVSVERGALQGFQHYSAVGLSLVGEATLRPVIAWCWSRPAWA